MDKVSLRARERGKNRPKAKVDNWERHQNQKKNYGELERFLSFIGVSNLVSIIWVQKSNLKKLNVSTHLSAEVGTEYYSFGVWTICAINLDGIEPYLIH
jgi:hypothetical protein